jgi:hypothetical protein
VPGGNLWDDGIESGDDVADIMGSWYRARFDGLSDADALRAGRIDFDVAKSLDYVDANVDRNAGGGLVDRLTQGFHYIDNGEAGRGELLDPLRPALKSHLLGWPADGRAELLPEAARQLSTRLDDAALADAHSVLRASPRAGLSPDAVRNLARDSSDAYLGRMRLRRDQVARGSFEYEPVPLMADPVQHMAWLRGIQVRP